jgi:hypothetical protein
MISAKLSLVLLRVKWGLVLIPLLAFVVLSVLPPRPTLFLRYHGNYAGLSYEDLIMLFGVLLSLVAFIFAVLACLPLTDPGVARERWSFRVAAVLSSFTMALAWGIGLLFSRM